MRLRLGGGLGPGLPCAGRVGGPWGLPSRLRPPQQPGWGAREASTWPKLALLWRPRAPSVGPCWSRRPLDPDLAQNQAKNGQKRFRSQNCGKFWQICHILAPKPSLLAIFRPRLAPPPRAPFSARKRLSGPPKGSPLWGLPLGPCRARGQGGPGPWAPGGPRTLILRVQGAPQGPGGHFGPLGPGGPKNPHFEGFGGPWGPPGQNPGFWALGAPEGPFWGWRGVPGAWAWVWA